MNLVLNATPLIYLTKAGLLWILEAVKREEFSTLPLTQKLWSAERKWGDRMPK